jgi:ankyrin repeat protein
MAKECPDALARMDCYKNTAASLAFSHGDLESSRAILGIMFKYFGYEAVKNFHDDPTGNFALMHAEWEAHEVEKSARKPEDCSEGAKRL